MAADHNEALIEKLDAMEERAEKAEAEVTRLSEQLETECQHEKEIIRLTVRDEAMTEAFCNLMNAVTGGNAAAKKAYDKINTYKAPEPSVSIYHNWSVDPKEPRGCLTCGHWADGTQNDRFCNGIVQIITPEEEGT